MDLVQLGLVQWSSKNVCGYAGFIMPDDLIVSKSTASKQEGKEITHTHALTHARTHTHTPV